MEEGMKREAKATKANPCMVCGAAMKTGSGPFRYTVTPDWAVTLEAVPIRTCGKCGEREHVVQGANELTRAIALAVIRKPGLLSAPEITFLRRTFDMTGREFAKLLGVSAGTISRWERGHERIGTMPDRYLRTLVVLNGEEGEPFDVRSLAGIEARGDGPINLALRLEADGWHARVVPPVSRAA
jgi:putative zinc finger/helix-turn-helix YgiT family protein